MSYELELSVERAIERLRGLARSGDYGPWLVAALDEISTSLEGPLVSARSARDDGVSR
jgi:hypothetical protein